MLIWGQSVRPWKAMSDPKSRTACKGVGRLKEGNPQESTYPETSARP